MFNKNDRAMEIATFRFGIIADFVRGGRLEYGEKQRLLQEKAERSYDIPGSTKTRVAVSTILAWISDYRKAGYKIEGLMPKQRKDFGSYRKLDAMLRMAIKELKLENPNYTVPAIIKMLKHRRVIGSEDKLNRVSIYRFIKREKLHEKSNPPKDKRRFEAPYPNAIWQSDVMHGPMVKTEKGPLKKSYLCAILDDHSRLIVHAKFYLDETLESLKDCFREAIMKRGIPQKFYVDNGANYRANNLEQVLAALGVILTHSRPYTPQGRGKIERWFRYVRQDFIPTEAHKPLTLDDLNEKLENWVDHYNDTNHSVTKMTPYEKFRSGLQCIRPAPEDLLDYFRYVDFRKVKKDRSIQLKGRLYEVPTGLIDKSVELRFHADDMDNIEVFYEGHSYGKAVPLNPHVNATIGRDYGDDHKTKEAASSNIDENDGEKKITTGKLFTNKDLWDLIYFKEEKWSVIISNFLGSKQIPSQQISSLEIL